MTIFLISLFFSFFISYLVFNKYSALLSILMGLVFFGLFSGSFYLFKVMTPFWVFIFMFPITITALLDKYYIKGGADYLGNLRSSVIKAPSFIYKNTFVTITFITVVIFTVYHVLAPLKMGYDGDSYWILMVDNSLRMIQSIAILNTESYPPEMMAELPLSSHSTHYHFGGPAIGALAAELLGTDPAVAYLRYSTPLIIVSSIFILFLLLGYFKSWYTASIVTAICLMPNLEMLLQVAYKLPGSFVISLFNDESTFNIWVKRALGYDWNWTYDAVLLDSAKAAIVQGFGLFLALYVLLGRTKAKAYFLAFAPFLLMMNSRFILPIVLIVMWQIIIYLFERIGKNAVYTVLGLFSAVFIFTVYVLTYSPIEKISVQWVGLAGVHPVSVVSIVLIIVFQVWFSGKVVNAKTRLVLVSYALPSILLLIYFNVFAFNLVSSQLLTVFNFNNLVLDNFSNFTLQMSLFLFVYYFSSSIFSWRKYYSIVIGFFILFGVGKTFGMAQNFYYLKTDISKVHQSVDFINYYNCLNSIDKNSVIIQNSQTYPPGNDGFDVAPEGFAAFYHMLGHKEAGEARQGIKLIADSKSTKAEIMSYLNDNQVDYIVIDKRFHSPHYFSSAVTYENDECKIVSVSKLPN